MAGMRVHRLAVWFVAGAGALLCAAGAAAGGDEPTLDLRGEVEALRAEVRRLQGREAEVETLRNEVAELRAKEEGSWLSGRRAEEVKSLIHEVLADAQTRASLAGDELTAGWDKNFFLASEDGNFLMTLSGQVQFRYIANFRDEPGDADEDDEEAGFQMRRAKLTFAGHAIDPRLEYQVEVQADRNGGEMILQDTFVRYEWADELFVMAGNFKPGFNREELVSSKRQQAVERSFVNGFFRIGRSQAVQVSGAHERWNWAVSLHDGREAENVDFHSDNTDVGLAGRVELLLAGEWKDLRQYAAWSGTPFGLMLGGGIDYELAESGSGTAFLYEDFWQWTADASLQLDPVNLFIAGHGRHVDGAGAIGGDFEQFGAVLQAGAFVIPDTVDVFGRWEWLDHDGFAEVASRPRAADLGLIAPGLEEELHIFTVGTNYYFKKHDAKLTLDLVWAPDGLRQSDTGAGLLASDTNDDLTALRAQLQVLF